MIKNIDDIPISTKTIIASSNLTIDILKVYQSFPLSETVETLYYGNEFRGKECVKKRKQSFRNAVNVISIIDNKKINFKLSKNGKFQLTGCKYDEHAFKIVTYFIETMLKHCDKDSVYINEPEIKISFRTVMTNIDFSIGFQINRLQLDKLINSDTKIYSLLETSCGYTGVNIKFPLTYQYQKDTIPVLISNNDIENLDFQMSHVSYDEIVTNTQKQKYNTFLVFHSGNIIMSGLNINSMREDCHRFQEMLYEWRDVIEEKIT